MSFSTLRGAGVALLLSSHSVNASVARALNPAPASVPAPTSFAGCCNDSTPSCSDAACINAVQAFDPFCTSTTWDTVCAHWSRAQSACAPACFSASLPVLCSAVDQPKFQTTIPVPTRLDNESPVPGTHLNFYFAAIDQNLGINYCAGGVPVTGTLVNTRVFGYGHDTPTGKVVSAPGATIVAKCGVPIDIVYENLITQRHILYPWTKTGYHSAEIEFCSASDRRYQQFDYSVTIPPTAGSFRTYNQLGEAGCVPTVPHLHGGFTRTNFDGLPDNVFVAKDLSVMYSYENKQEGGSTIWIHDHSLGITALNVAAGMASFYLVRDENELKKFAPDNSCGVTQYNAADPYAGCELEIVLSNRDFDRAGNLIREVDPVSGLPVIGAPEFFGEWSLVNGAVWPVMPVAKSWYRLRLLNGADSNIMALQLLAKCSAADTKGTVVPFLVIGRDQGFIDKATTVGIAGSIPLSPIELANLSVAEQINLYRTQYLNLETGSRADVLVDLSAYADSCEFTLFNVAGTPFNIINPFGVNADPANSIPAGGIAGVTRPNPDTNGQFMKLKFAAGIPSHARCLPSQFKDNYFPTHTSAAAFDAKHRSLFLSEHLETFNGANRPQVVLGAAVDPFTYDSAPTNLSTALLLPTLQWCRDEIQQLFASNFDPRADPLTEKPILNTRESWVMYNISPDTHPIHLHLVAFTVVKRCPIVQPAPADLLDCSVGDLSTQVFCSNSNAVVRARAAVLTDLNSPDCVGPAADELAPRDIVQAWNGYATVISVPWGKEGQYVWHCHILSHEDNEMMAPVCVLPFAGADSRTVCPDYYEACGYNDFRATGTPAVPLLYPPTA